MLFLACFDVCCLSCVVFCDMICAVCVVCLLLFICNYFLCVAIVSRVLHVVADMFYEMYFLVCVCDALYATNCLMVIVCRVLRGVAVMYWFL